MRLLRWVPSAIPVAEPILLWLLLSMPQVACIAANNCQTTFYYSLPII